MWAADRITLQYCNIEIYIYDKYTYVYYNVLVHSLPALFYIPVYYESIQK